MVYMKKATPNKRQQQQFKKGKKAVQGKPEDNDFDMNDSDDNVDIDEAPQLQRTPANKGARGRQSMSEKKVSFSIPARNSPAVKTPKKDNSILVKKQPTPASKGRTSMQEFKGIKGKEAQVKEDGDDNDEDDDFEMDEDEEEEDDDLDLDIDEGDDVEDDDDEEDDDDDDDEEDDEEEGIIKKKLSLLKQNNVQPKKTPVGQNDKAKNAESPAKGQTPKKEKAASNLSPQEVNDEIERRKQRDTKMLFIGGLPNDVTEEELKSLSPDIVEITLPSGNRKQAKTAFAFLSFDTEAKAESNYTTLQSKKFRDQPLTLDFVGFKSKNMKVSDDAHLRFNLKKLFVAGIPIQTTIDQIANFFKAAIHISFNRTPVFRTAVITFDTVEEAKDAHDSNREIVISGHKLPVLYSRQSGPGDSRKRKNRNRRPNINRGGNPAKRMRFIKPE